MYLGHSSCAIAQPYCQSPRPKKYKWSTINDDSFVRTRKLISRSSCSYRNSFRYLVSISEYIFCAMLGFLHSLYFVSVVLLFLAIRIRNSSMESTHNTELSQILYQKTKNDASHSS